MAYGDMYIAKRSINHNDKKEIGFNMHLDFKIIIKVKLKVEK